MELINCKLCGNLFRSSGRDVCEKCKKSEDDEYRKVKDYLRKRPQAAVFEVSQKTGVAISRIHTFIRQGRLATMINDHSLECLSCGKSIHSGRLCNNCAQVVKSVTEETDRESPVKFSDKGKVYSSKKNRRR